MYASAHAHPPPSRRPHGQAAFAAAPSHHQQQHSNNSRSISRDHAHDLDRERNRDFDYEQKHPTPFVAERDRDRDREREVSPTSFSAAHRHHDQQREESVNKSQSGGGGVVSGAFAAQQDDASAEEAAAAAVAAAGGISEEEAAPMVAWHEVSATLAKANTDGVQATFLMQSDGFLFASAVTRPLTESNLKKVTGAGAGSEAKTPFDEVASSTASSLTSTPFTTPMTSSRPAASGSVYGGPPPDYSSRRDSAATIPPFQPHSYGTNASVIDFRDARSPVYPVDNRSHRRAGTPPDREQQEQRPKQQRTRESDRELRGIVAQMWHKYKAAAEYAFGGQNLTSLCFEQQYGIVYAHKVEPYLLLMYAAKNTPLGLMRVKAEELALILNLTLVSAYDEAAVDENADDQGGADGLHD